MLALRLLKQTSRMERKQGSNLMAMTVDTCLDKGLILPITIDDKYIISEAKVVNNNIFASQIKIVLKSDSEIIPTFEVYDTSALLPNSELVKHTNNGTTQRQLDEMETLANSKLIELRPCTISMLKVLIPDLLDYSGLQNLELNVRFK